MSFVGWEPLPEDVTTGSQIFAVNGYMRLRWSIRRRNNRGGMNCDSGLMRRDRHGRHLTWAPAPRIDNIRRRFRASPVTSWTTKDHGLLYSMDEGMSDLYNLNDDPRQLNDLIGAVKDTGGDLHGMLVEFMKQTNVAEGLPAPKLELSL